jgi:hypothetical protein
MSTGQLWEHVLYLFRMGQIDTAKANMLIDACRRPLRLSSGLEDKGRQSAMALQIFELMYWNGISPDTYTLNLLVRPIYVCMPCALL